MELFQVDNQTQTMSQGLKQSIAQNTAAINAAVSKISETKGYQCDLSLNGFRTAITFSLSDHI